MTFVLPGAGSVPVPQAVPFLTTGFSRNPAMFPVVKYTQLIPVTATLGYYLETAPDEGARIRTTRANWPDGEPRPQGFKPKHEWKSYSALRSSENFRIGTLTAQQALAAGKWDILASFANVAAQRAMTNYTREVEKFTTDTSNGTPTATFGTASGGGSTIAGSTAANAYIEKTFDYGVDAIMDSTYGAVKPSQIRAIVGRTTARAIVQSPEYKSYFTNWAQAAALLEKSGNLNQYGLVLDVFGVKTIVEDTVFESAKPDATSSKRRAYQGLGTVNSVAVHSPIVFVVVPEANEMTAEAVGDGQTSPVNRPTTTAILRIAPEEMTYELDIKPFDRLTDGAVTCNHAVVLASTKSIYMVTNVLNGS